MPQIVPLGVQLIAKTEFTTPVGVPWTTDADGGQALAEFAGRACYQSWGKPNPATATNAGYLRHILEVGHLSVLEHGTVSFYLTGISRSLTHELIRHRHFSPPRPPPPPPPRLPPPPPLLLQPALPALRARAQRRHGRARCDRGRSRAARAVRRGRRRRDQGLRGAAGRPGEAVRRRPQC